jgi:hypothetical protein
MPIQRSMKGSKSVGSEHLRSLWKVLESLISETYEFKNAIYLRHIRAYSLPYAPGELQMEPET